MNWNAPKLWEGNRCFILGGGSSISEQFGVPDDIVRKVMDKKLPISAYSEFIKPLLKEERVIAINAAFKIGNWIDCMFFGDAGWYLPNREQLINFGGIKVTCAPKFASKRVDQSEGIKYLGRDGKKTEGISDQTNTVCWNKNSGAASISLAAHFGCKQIILLGFDMNMIEMEGKLNHHWHTDYKSQKQPPFKRHLKGFGQIAIDAKQRNIEILNCSPDSAIKEFPIVNLKEVLSV